MRYQIFLCWLSNIANIHILTCNLVETVEAKLEVNVAKSVDTTFSQETGDRLGQFYFFAQSQISHLNW